VESLRWVIFRKDRIHSFDIRNSLFDIRYSLFRVSFSINLAVFLANGHALMKLIRKIILERLL